MRYEIFKKLALSMLMAAFIMIIAATTVSAYQEQKGKQKPVPQQTKPAPQTQQPPQESKQIPQQRKAVPRQMPQPMPQQRKQEAKRIPNQIPQQPLPTQQIPQQRKQEAKRIPQQLPPTQQIPQQRKQEAKRIPNQLPQQRTERLPNQRRPDTTMPSQQPRFPVGGETVRGRRIDQTEQRQLQRQRYNDYDNRWQNWRNVQWQRQNDLRRNRRSNYLRYHDRYWNHIQQDHLRLGNARYYDNLYYNYGYWRGGSYYYTSVYGAQLIDQAIRYGYEEGYRAGQADRLDGWIYDPYQSYGYVDAAYGYDSYYVGMDEYSYYFREGYLRGYEDGYYRYYHYGRYSAGHFLILDSVLRAIFTFVVH